MAIKAALHRLFLKWFLIHFKWRSSPSFSQFDGPKAFFPQIQQAGAPTSERYLYQHLNRLEKGSPKDHPCEVWQCNNKLASQQTVTTRDFFNLFGKGP